VAKRAQVDGGRGKMGGNAGFPLNPNINKKIRIFPLKIYKKTKI
jgi:hypothetical protein